MDIHDIIRAAPAGFVCLKHLLDKSNLVLACLKLLGHKECVLVPFQHGTCRSHDAVSSFCLSGHTIPFKEHLIQIVERKSG